mmetsp:Transcript_66771/g.204345  ORF Transcript_66771/g.204345 Transcript_66771/m.204345 type:complete len:212 (-) Transcript_66771:4244-4879(-)
MKSWMYMSVASHLCTSSSKGLQNGLLRMACVLEMWSSSTVWMSSMPRSRGTPLRSLVLNSSGSQSRFMPAMAFFSPCSLAAAVESSSKSAENWLTPMSNIICSVISVKGAGGSIFMRLNISVQCRSKTDSVPNAFRNGNWTLKSSMACRNSFAIFCILRMLSLSKVLIILYTSLNHWSSNASMSTEFKDATGWDSQSFSFCWNWMMLFHKK